MPSLCCSCLLKKILARERDVIEFSCDAYHRTTRCILSLILLSSLSTNLIDPTRTIISSLSPPLPSQYLYTLCAAYTKSVTKAGRTKMLDVFPQFW